MLSYSPIRTQKRLQIIGLLLALSLPVYALAITPEALQDYKQGLTFERVGDLEQAEQAYRLSIGLDPTDSLVYLKLGALVERKQHFTEALQLYKTALDLNPRDTLVHIQIARVYEAQNQPYMALSHYLMITDSPSINYPYVYLPIARLQAKINDSAKAMESYQRFLSAYPNHPDAQRELGELQRHYAPQPIVVNTQTGCSNRNATSGHMDLALPPLPTLPGDIKTPAAAKSPAKVATNYLDEAQAYERAGKLPEAVEAYRKHIAQDPKKNAPAYLNIATLSETQGKLGDLKKALNNYQAFDASNVDVARRLGDLELSDNNPKAAVLQYEKALLNSKDARQQTDIRKQLGYAQQLRGDYQDAIAAYEVVLKNQDDPAIRKNLALAYQQDGQYEKAAALYRGFIAAESADSSLRQDMGKVLSKLGEKAIEQKNFPAAQNYYAELKQVHPADAELADKQLAQIEVLKAPKAGRIDLADSEVETNVIPQPQKSVGSSNRPANSQPVSQPGLASQTATKPISQNTAPTSASAYYYPTETKPQPSQTTPSVMVPESTESPQPYGMRSVTTPKTTVAASASKPVISKHSIPSTLPDLSAHPRQTAPEISSVEDLNDNVSVATTSTTHQPVSAKSLMAPNYQKQLKAAQLAYEQKNYQTAIDNLQSLSNANLATVESYTLLAKAQQANNDIAQATQNYERAAELAPNDTTILFSLGQLYRQDEQLDKAQAAFEKVLATEKTPPTAQLLYELGVVYHLQKRYEEAVKSFQQATQINPSWPEGYYGLGVAYEGIKAYKKAIGAYDGYLKYTDTKQPMYENIKKHVALLNNYLIMKQQQSPASN